MNRVLVGSLLLTFAVACGGSNTTKGDYTLNLSGYGPHAGKTVRMKVKSGNTTVGSAASATVKDDGSATLTAPGVLDEGASYNVDWFVDNDANGTCDACGTAGGEHAWRKVSTGKSAGLTETHTHDTTFTNIAPF